MENSDNQQGNQQGNQKGNQQGNQQGNHQGKQGGNQQGGNQQGGNQQGGNQQGGNGQDGSDSQDENNGEGNGSGNKKCPNCGHEHNNNQSRQGEKDTSGNDKYGEYGKNGAEMYSLDTIFEGEEREEQNTLDAHLGDDIPQELKREIVEGTMSKLKNRGLTSGDVETILNKLRKTKKDYLKEIKRAMSNHVFGSKKQKTIARPIS